MKVFVYPADNAGCGHSRLIYPARALAARGIDVTIIHDGTVTTDATVLQPKEPGGRWHISDATVPDCDVMVFQRPSHPAVEALIRFLRTRGIRIVIDIDDRFDAVPPQNMAWHYYRSERHTIRVLRDALANADAVTCSTPELATLHNGILLENCIPASFLDVPDVHDPVVGWAGTLAVHRGDLKVVGGGVAAALDGTDWGFRIVGPPDGIQSELSLRSEPEATGWLPIDEYYRAMASFGIGIAPLEDNPFNRAKSWLKPLEYAALGVPFVASNLPEYRRLGVGMIANNPRQWKGMVQSLMRDPLAREDLRMAGRACARHWTYEGNVDRWAQVWLGEH